MIRNLLPLLLLLLGIAASAQEKKSSFTWNSTTFTFTAPDSFEVNMIEESCSLIPKGVEPGDASLLLTITVVDKSDAGPEQKLNLRPDGALSFFKEILPGVEVTEKDTMTVFGQKIVYHFVRGRIEFDPSSSQIKELMIFVMDSGKNNVLFTAIYPEGRRTELSALAIRIARSISLTP